MVAQHQPKNELRKRIAEANATHVLHRMIDPEEDIEATVAALEAIVPTGSETFAPPCPTASGILTTYFGNVRVVKAFDPVEGRMIMRADLYYREAQWPRQYLINTTPLGESLSATPAFPLCWFRVGVPVFRID
jgi:hypothetical protein